MNKDNFLIEFAGKNIFFILDDDDRHSFFESKFKCPLPSIQEFSFKNCLQNTKIYQDDIRLRLDQARTLILRDSIQFNEKNLEFDNIKNNLKRDEISNIDFPDLIENYLKNLECQSKILENLSITYTKYIHYLFVCSSLISNRKDPLIELSYLKKRIVWTHPLLLKSDCQQTVCVDNLEHEIFISYLFLLLILVKRTCLMEKKLSIQNYRQNLFPISSINKEPIEVKKELDTIILKWNSLNSSFNKLLNFWNESEKKLSQYISNTKIRDDNHLDSLMKETCFLFSHYCSSISNILVYKKLQIERDKPAFWNLYISLGLHLTNLIKTKIETLNESHYKNSPLTLFLYLSYSHLLHFYDSVVKGFIALCELENHYEHTLLNKNQEYDKTYPTISWFLLLVINNFPILSKQLYSNKTSPNLFNKIAFCFVMKPLIEKLSSWKDLINRNIKEEDIVEEWINQTISTETNFDGDYFIQWNINSQKDSDLEYHILDISQKEENSTQFYIDQYQSNKTDPFTNQKIDKNKHPFLTDTHHHLSELLKKYFSCYTKEKPNQLLSFISSNTQTTKTNVSIKKIFFKKKIKNTPYLKNNYCSFNNAQFLFIILFFEHQYTKKYIQEIKYIPKSEKIFDSYSSHFFFRTYQINFSITLKNNNQNVLVLDLDKNNYIENKYIRTTLHQKKVAITGEIKNLDKHILEKHNQDLIRNPIYILTPIFPQIKDISKNYNEKIETIFKETISSKISSQKTTQYAKKMFETKFSKYDGKLFKISTNNQEEHSLIKPEVQNHFVYNVYQEMINKFMEFDYKDWLQKIASDVIINL